MINYNTPITDAILQKNGWIRFENTPVYVKKLENQHIILKSELTIIYGIWTDLLRIGLKVITVVNTV